MIIGKVMLIDDDPDIRKIGQLSLESVGKWAVVIATTGREAIELAHRERPDVILLDVVMPDLDGFATLRLLRSQASTAHIPVIFLTAKSQAAEREALIAVGAAGVIAKPFNPLTLPSGVSAILRG